MTIPSALNRKYGNKSIIRQTDYNALVDMATADRFLSSGVVDVMGGGNYDHGLIPDKQGIGCWCGIEIPLYAVFCLKPDPDVVDVSGSGVLYLEVEQANEDNQQLYFTNSESGAFGDYSGSSFSCVAELMSGNKIYMLRLYTTTGTPSDATLPRPGYPCGVKINTFEIDGAGVGFICVAVDEPNKYVWATVAPSGQRFLCKPTAAIASASEGEVILWRGPKGAEVETDPQAKYKPYNRTSAECGEDKFCEMVVIDGKAYIVPWECVPAGTEPPVGPATATGGALDVFDRTIDDDIGIGAVPGGGYTPIFGSIIDDFVIVARSGSNHACQCLTADTGVIFVDDMTSTSTQYVNVEIEVVALAVGDAITMILSYLDDDNCYIVEFEKETGGSSYAITIKQIEATVTTILATASIPLPLGGSQYWMVGRIDYMTGAIRGYIRDNFFTMSANVEAVYVPNGGQQCGFGASSISGTTDVDNFKVDEYHTV